ncbi:phosphorylase family protein [Cystoisospora suis]|uniref:Phosphorylase family protein n=1 Tax=Cystoisospora suis TaxID=483139 RepID=A0A2C6KP66_9APIC|nr:phosphorylase family protein [Cystoisospora suis]
MASLEGKDIFLSPDGRVYHLGLKASELSPLIVTVGSEKRAALLANHFLTDVKSIRSDRQFTTFTGTYRGEKKISVISIGMGAPMMDFMLREASFLLGGGPMAVVRIGTCGILEKTTPPGTLMLVDKSMYAYRNYCFFDGGVSVDVKTGAVSPLECKSSKEQSYLLSQPIAADPQLTELIEEGISKSGENAKMKKGLNCSGESFFSCQGRSCPPWNDENRDLVDQFSILGVHSLEMETHQLFHLMHHRGRMHDENEEGQNQGGRRMSRAAAVMVGIVNRSNPEFTAHVTDEDQEKAVLVAGKAVLDALVSLPEFTDTPPKCVVPA